MDIKWKRFCRNEIVRMVCNIALIACIVLGAVFVNQIKSCEVAYSANLDKGGSPVDLFDDVEFQNEVRKQCKQVLAYMMAESEADAEAETMKKELDDTLAGMYDYEIVYTDMGGKKHELSNCDSGDISDDSIQVKYEGVMHGDTYERDWENLYYGTLYSQDDKEQLHTVDFEWLNVGDLMKNIISESPSYCESITNEMLNHLELYRDSLQKFLCYLATEENVPGYTAVEKSTYYKIYERYPIFEALDFEEYAEEYEYDETSGLYMDEYEQMYYNPQKEEWYDVDSVQYKKYRNDMTKKMESIRNILAKEEVKKTADNVFQLTKEEKENLSQNISNSLKRYYVESFDQYAEEEQVLEVSFSFSAMLKTPASYIIRFGVKKHYMQTRMETYYASWEKARSERAELDKKIENYTIYLVIDAVCAGLLMLFLCYVCGRKADTEEVQFLFFDYWKTEVILLIGFVIAMGVMLGMYNGFANGRMYQSEYWYRIGKDNFGVILAEIGVCLWLLLQVFYSLLRRIKAKTLYKNSILALWMGRMQGVVNQGTLNRKLTLSMILLFVVCVFIEYVAMHEVAEWNTGEAVCLLLIMDGIWLLVFAYVNRGVRKLSIIMEGVKKIREGELTYQIPTDGTQNHINQLAQDINSLSDGLGKAVDDRIRSERLKTELISNVSHDIKTPLTSIITYVDLLKREDVQPEKAKEYVEVLDQKSQRLKVLTDDLFEAAKASSGAMATEITKIDIGALVCQAAGEFSEKFEKSELELRNSIQDNVWFVQADGRLAWRIVENLFSNVTKYAQPNSRVYVDAEQKGPMIEIVVKNVSAYELNISAEELMERFTRGDQSRNTEGSGLGLNIAKSLAELQGGRFFLEIDGDLFKAVLQLPMAQ